MLMRKLRTFIVQGCKVLSAEEMAAIEGGGGGIPPVGPCESDIHVGGTCEYTVYLNGEDYTYLGTCRVGYRNSDNTGKYIFCSVSR